jgi:hypothetical protein
MHAHVPPIDIVEEAKLPPLSFNSGVVVAFKVATGIGIATFFLGLLLTSAARVWASYFVSLVFFMGLAAGGVILSAIFQIVRATWSASLRRIAEANIAFLPIALVGLLLTWFGRLELFPWARSPKPGSEWWMQPGFVYVRNGIFLAFTFYLMWRFVSMSLRGDRKIVNEINSSNNPKFSSSEIVDLQRSMSRFAPLLIIVYGLAYSFFAFEMVMAMDTAWISNLFGAYYFVGNVYIGWAALAILAVYFSAQDSRFGSLIDEQVRWDLGKLTFGFCMVWGYFSLSQFLPQWYGNLPEETQWLILRAREYPWKYFLYFMFGCAWVFPFITLLSREVKRRSCFLAAVCSVILIGVWSEKFFVIMPHVSPNRIPFGLLDIGLFLGFFGLYGLSIRFFLSRTPRLAIGHPLSRGEYGW